MKAEIMGRKTIKTINSIVNFIVLIIVVLLLAFAGYALWDSNQIFRAADKSNYEIYKPTKENGGKSFKELQAINPEVFAWLTVFGTNIDYPVAQGPNNMKYVNTNAEGRYSLSGAIFLDIQNQKDFSDFNSILYGHHMAQKVMFGEIGEFANIEMFESRRFGNLYFDGQDHGLEFFAFVQADAYDNSVFIPDVQGDERQVYLDNLLAKAKFSRNIRVTVDDHIVLLSTCSSNATNGRDILIGRISDEVYANPFPDEKTNDGFRNKKASNLCCSTKGLPLWALLLILVIAVRMIIYILDKHNRRYQRQNKRERR